MAIDEISKALAHQEKTKNRMAFKALSQLVDLSHSKTTDCAESQMP